jgi:hypothetical protein
VLGEMQRLGAIAEERGKALAEIRRASSSASAPIRAAVAWRSPAASVFTRVSTC